MTEPDVSLRSLTKLYGNVVAVDGIDLDVPRGAFVSLLGPSGCGKSTTLRLIGGFEHPDRGEVRIKGQRMGATPPHKRETSMVFQSYGMFPHLSVADNIAFGLRERKVPKDEIRARVARMLEMVELPGLEERMPRQLSGGQQQRVALARSLVIEPAVLLLDEPLGALDLRLRAQMQVALKRIQQQVGITFIYVTHDQGEALAMSDRIVVMSHGRIEQDGRTEDVFERPRTRFVAGFMGSPNILDVDIADRDGTSTLVRCGSRELTLPERVPAGVRTGALVIRPEKVRLDVAGGWEGRVAGRLYKGLTMSYQIALDDGTAITAEVAHDDISHRHDIGDDVRVSFRPGDAIFIPDRERAVGTDARS